MHFLGIIEHRQSLPVGRPWALATARLTRIDGKNVLVLCRLEDMPKGKLPIGIADAQTMVVSLPPEVKVVRPDGQVVTPSKGRIFYVTVETFDPFHGIMEGPPDLERL